MFPGQFRRASYYFHPRHRILLLASLGIFFYLIFFFYSHQSQARPFDLPLQSPINAEVDDHISRLCRSNTEWKKDIWLKCHNECHSNVAGGREAICGGMNNIRNRYSTCIRLAIDAGVGLILAPLTTRKPEDIRNVDGGDVLDPNAYFDIDSLAAYLRRSCPELHLAAHDDSKNLGHAVEMPQRHYGDAPFSSREGTTFRDAMKSAIDFAGINLNNQKDYSQARAVVNFHDPYVAWNYSDSNETTTVQRTLFHELRYASQLRTLGLEVRAAEPLSHGYIGVHLRGETDWVPHFGDMELQMELFSNELKKLDGDIRDVYVGCGNSSVIQVFRDRLQPLGFVVHDKWSLLADRPQQSAQLEALLFDQGAAVEYEVTDRRRLVCWIGNVNVVAYGGIRAGNVRREGLFRGIHHPRKFKGA